MSERKKYVIAGKEFQLKENQTLKVRAEIDALTTKIPFTGSADINGMSIKETQRFFFLILERVPDTIGFIEHLIIRFLKEWYYNRLFAKMDEDTELEVSADFFIRRITLRLDGITRLKNTIKNTNVLEQPLRDILK